MFDADIGISICEHAHALRAAAMEKNHSNILKLLRSNAVHSRLSNSLLSFNLTLVAFRREYSPVQLEIQRKDFSIRETETTPDRKRY
jgi:hypothetical protein